MIPEGKKKLFLMDENVKGLQLVSTVGSKLGFLEIYSFGTSFTVINILSNTYLWQTEHYEEMNGSCEQAHHC